MRRLFANNTTGRIEILALGVAAILIAQMIAVLPFAGSGFFFWTAIGGRALLFQATSLTVAALVLTSKLWRWDFSRKIDLPDISLYAFLLAAVASTALSVHPPTALYGFPGKSEGLVALGLLAALYFSAKRLAGENDRIAPLLGKTLVISAAAVAFASLADLAGKNFDTRLITYGPIFNRTLLGSYLAMVFPISLALSVSGGGGKRGGRAGWAAAAALILFSLIVTLSRAAWLSALPAAAGVLWLYRARARRLALGTAALILAAAIAGTMLAAAANPALARAVISRTASAVRLEEGNWPRRLELWKSALRVVSERPLFGSGPDTFAYAYPTAATRKFLDITPEVYGDDTLSKDVHNHFFQVGATLGLPALIFYLAFISLTVVRGARAAARSTGINRAWLPGMFVAVPALFVNLFFTPSSVIILPIAWVILGVIGASTDPGIKKSDGFRPGVNFRLLLAGLTIAIAGIGGYIFVARPAVADHYLARSYGENYYDDLAYVDRAIRIFPGWDLHQRHRADLNQRLFLLTGDERLLKEMLADAQNAVEANRVNPYNYYYLAKLQLLAYKQGGGVTLAEAEQSLRNALRLFPLYPEARLELAKIRTATGE